MLRILFFGLALVSAVSGAIRSYAGGPPPPSYGYSYESPPKYNFGWNVNDPYSGNDFNHNEQRENDVTSGSYSVRLPDGRLQKVTYSVSGEGGYQAEVTYEGTASNGYYASETRNSKPIKVVKTIHESSSSPQGATFSKKTPFSSLASSPSSTSIRKYTYRPISDSDLSSTTLKPLETVVVSNPLPLATSSSLISISTTPAPQRKKYTYKIKDDKPKRDVHFPKLFHF